MKFLKLTCPQCNLLHGMSNKEMSGTSVCTCGFILIDNGVVKAGNQAEDITNYERPSVDSRKAP